MPWGSLVGGETAVSSAATWKEGHGVCNFVIRCDREADLGICNFVIPDLIRDPFQIAGTFGLFGAEPSG
jgi:hypothetical protein